MRRIVCISLIHPQKPCVHGHGTGIYPESQCTCGPGHPGSSGDACDLGPFRPVASITGSPLTKMITAIETQSRKLLTYFFSFGPSQHSLRLFCWGRVWAKPSRLWAQLGLGYSSRYFLSPSINPPPTLVRRPVGPPAPSGFAALAKAFTGNKFRPNPRGCGLNSGRATPLAVC